MIGVAERVVNGGQVEDDYTECKAEWPTDHRKAARQIAGLCNAARGAEALWIVGLDERRQIVAESTPTEPADWWPQVARCFAEVVPEVTTLIVTTATGDVTALLFETDRSPYVTKVGDGGQVQREVPWRTSTGLYSATRHQLLSVLVPNLGTPELELINPEISSISATASAESVMFAADLFITAAERVMLPNHRWSLTIESDEWDAEGWGPLRPTLNVQRIGLDEEGPGVRVLDHSGIYVNGSGRVHLTAEWNSSTWSSDHSQTLRYQPFLRVVLDMPVDRHSRSARATVTLRYTPTNTVGDLWREAPTASCR